MYYDFFYYYQITSYIMNSRLIYQMHVQGQVCWLNVCLWVKLLLTLWKSRTIEFYVSLNYTFGKNLINVYGPTCVMFIIHT